MNKPFILCFCIFLISHLFCGEKKQVFLQDKIEVVINAEKVFHLPVYKIKDKKEHYILLKDLAKIFSATLTYHSVSGEVSFNHRGDKLFFYLHKNFFLWKNKRIYLSSETIFANNRVYVPISIFHSPEFCSFVGSNIQFVKSTNVLLVNSVDNILINYYYDKNYAKIQFSFSQPIRYEYYYKDHGINLNFFGAKVQQREYTINDSIISKINVVQKSTYSYVRIILTDLNVEIKRIDNKNRLILEFKKCAPTKDDVSVYSKEIFISTGDITNSVITQFPVGKVIKTIVIDPGHGGEDPGAIGPKGTMEKNINLAVAKYLRNMLVNDGYQVYLTREDDSFIPLVQRTKFANDKNADIFISIHCNATGKFRKTNTGFEIYFLSEETSTDPDIIATEKLENEVIRFEKPTPELEKLQKLLWSMIVTEFINDSALLCNLIVKEVQQQVHQIPVRGTKQGKFYVLRGAQMPAVLVELGFISNSQEELLLNKPSIQIALSNSIYAGIKNYEQSKIVQTR